MYKEEDPYQTSLMLSSATIMGAVALQASTR